MANSAVPPAPPGEPARSSSTARSAAFTYSTQLTIALLSLANVLVVARALGPSGRGEVVFLITIAVLSSQLASLSVSEAISVFAGRSPERQPALATNAAILAGALGLLATVVLAGLMSVFPSIGPHLGLGVRLVALGVIAPLILQEYLSRLAMAEYRFAISNVSLLAPAAVQLTLNGLLLLAGSLTVTSALLAWVCGWIVSVAVLVWGVGVRGSGFGRPDAGLARAMAGFGLRAHGSRSLAWSNYRLDQWLVGALAGSRELGLYSVAVAWAEGLFLLPQAIAIVQRPDVVRDDAVTAGRRAAGNFRLTVVATTPLVLGLVVLAPFLCTRVFGPDFAGSVGQLRVLAFGAFGIVAGKVLGSALIAQRHPLLETIATAGAFVVTLVLDLFLIPQHGGMGASVASTVGYSAGGLVVGLVTARTLRFRAGALVPVRSDLRLARLTLGTLRRREA